MTGAVNVATLAVSDEGAFEAKVWDARTGMLLFDLKGLPTNFPGGDNPRVSIAFSPDSKRLVTAGGDKTARVWDATTGALQLELKEDAGEVQCAAFGPDGTQIATGYNAGASSRVKVWDARTGKPLLEWRAHKSRVTRLSFSPDGTRILTGGDDQAVKVWDARKGTLLLDAKGMMSLESSVAFSPDGKRLVAGRDDGSAVIDAEKGTVLLELKGAGTCRIPNRRARPACERGVQPDAPGSSPRAQPATSHGEASVWDARTGAELLELKGIPPWC